MSQPRSDGMALVAHDESSAPQLGERYGDLVESLTDLARTLTETESVRDTLQSILALALRSIPGCHAASITVLDATEQPSTIAATDEKTYELDRRQYLLHDGPCMDAGRGRHRGGRPLLRGPRPGDTARTGPAVPGGDRPRDRHHHGRVTL